MTARGAWLLAVVLSTGGPVGQDYRPITAGPGQDGPPIDAHALIDAWASGRYEVLPAALNRPFAVENLRKALEKVRFDPADRKRHEQAAALAVEAVQFAGAYHPAATFELIEWGCRLLRRDSVATEAERLFHRGAVAVLEGMTNPSVVTHAEHGLRRFPADPRFELARAVAVELQTFPDPEPSVRLGQRDGTLFARLVDRLERAARFPEVRAEALARLGFAHLRDRHPERALAQLDHVPALTEDPWVLYLAHLFRGRALEALGRDDEAVEALRAAVAAVPGAQSAALALGAALLRTGAREEASAIAWASTAVPAVADPWIGYGQADLRFWPQIRDRLREAVR